MRTPRAAARIPRRTRSFQWDYRWMPYPATGRLLEHPHDGAVATYRGHSVLGTLIRAYWSPEFSTGQRYIYSGSSDGAAVIYGGLCPSQRCQFVCAHLTVNASRVLLSLLCSSPYCAPLPIGLRSLAPRRRRARPDPAPLPPPPAPQTW